jgi:glyoxylase-like metal-dependent hydrolase (beta-lactamase superfamily II)
MIVRQISTGGDRNFGYIAGDKEGGEGIIVDPSYNPQLLWDTSQGLKLNIKYILCTHGHFDHTNGNEEIKKLSGKKPLLYGEKDIETGITFNDGDIIPLGNLIIKVLHTPGHTANSMCLYTGNSLFTGDTLFVGKIGGTSGRENALTQYKALHEKIMTLPDDTMIYSGHNYGISPISTIGDEKKNNPFILQQDFEAFFYLKNNWSQYKLEHGIK